MRLSIALTFFGFLSCLLGKTQEQTVNFQKIDSFSLPDPTNEQRKRVQSTASSPTSAVVNLPHFWDLSRFLPVAGFQGKEQGSCSAFTVAYGIKAIQENKRLNKTRPESNISLSAAYVFNRAKETRGDIYDCRRGVTLIEALTVLKDEGTVTAQEFKYFPFDAEGCQAVVPLDLRKAAKKYRISSFDAPELNELDFKRIIAQNVPIAIAVKIDASFDIMGFRSGVWSKEKPFIWSSYNSNEKDRVRHAMLVVGYDDSLGAFKVLNSWGTEFGVNGFFYISYSFMFKATYDAYIAIDRINPLMDIPVIRPTGDGSVESLDSSVKSNRFSSWIKQGYYRDFGDFRVGCIFVSEKSKVATFQIFDTSESSKSPLTTIDLEIGESKSFEYEGRVHTLALNAIDNAGVNFLTRTFNIHGKGAYFDYKIGFRE